jgi:hypothetical protein
MARHKKTYALHVEKNQVPQGGWLARFVVSSEEESHLDKYPVYAAFTTAAAGKRFLAAAVGRSRITWDDDNGDGMSFSATVEVKD